MTNDEISAGLPFVNRGSSLFRHSSFVIQSFSRLAALIMRFILFLISSALCFGPADEAVGNAIDKPLRSSQCSRGLLQPG